MPPKNPFNYQTCHAKLRTPLRFGPVLEELSFCAFVARSLARFGATQQRLECNQRGDETTVLCENVHTAKRQVAQNIISHLHPHGRIVPPHQIPPLISQQVNFALGHANACPKLNLERGIPSPLQKRHGSEALRPPRSYRPVAPELLERSESAGNT